MDMSGSSPPRLLDRVRAEVRVRHYSLRTEQAYVDWIRRFILFHGKRHPAAMGEAEIQAFLTHLAVDKSVAASTQNQALSALLFLYRQVLGRELGDLSGVTRARRSRRRRQRLPPRRRRRRRSGESSGARAKRSPPAPRSGSGSGSISSARGKRRRAFLFRWSRRSAVPV